MKFELYIDGNPYEGYFPGRMTPEKKDLFMARNLIKNTIAQVYQSKLLPDIVIRLDYRDRVYFGIDMMNLKKDMVSQDNLERIIFSVIYNHDL